jgi:hypothetical protein
VLISLLYPIYAQKATALGTIQTNFEMEGRFTGDPNYPRTKKYNEIQKYAYIAAYTKAKMMYNGNVDVHSFNIHIDRNENNKTYFIMLAQVTRLPDDQQPRLLQFTRPLTKEESVIDTVTKSILFSGKSLENKLLYYLDEEFMDYIHGALYSEATSRHGFQVDIRNISLEISESTPERTEITAKGDVVFSMFGIMFEPELDVEE